MSARALVVGAKGLLGTALLAAGTGRPGWQVLGADRDELDITNRASLEAVILGYAPQVIFNAAGYTQVDRAEAEPLAAYEANSVGPGVLAAVAAECGARLIHVSTDHIFGGPGRTPWQPDDEPAPVSVYGWSKLLGERNARAVAPNTYVVRTAGLFGPGGRNFVDAIIGAAHRGQPLRVVDDQYCQRTYSPDLAAALWALAEARPAEPIWHFTNEGGVSWHAFAVAVLAAVGLEVDCAPVSSAAWGAPAVRPAWSVLALSDWPAVGLPAPRPALDAVAEHLRMKVKEQREGGQR